MAHQLQDVRGLGHSMIVGSEKGGTTELFPIQRIRRPRGIDNNNTFTWSGPSGVLGCIGQRPLGRVAGSHRQGDGCRALPLNAAESGVTRNLRGGKRSRLRFWKGALVAHQ
jgi:hypothetical protein